MSFGQSKNRAALAQRSVSAVLVSRHQGKTIFNSFQEKFGGRALKN